ncbi:hypothetical protein TURU_098371 [Turdus rufiventris]|nr:hypothetical protein TURU_098371 [Turdus rufiventris]
MHQETQVSLIDSSVEAKIYMSSKLLPFAFAYSDILHKGNMDCAAILNRCGNAAWNADTCKAQGWLRLSLQYLKGVTALLTVRRRAPRQGESALPIFIWTLGHSKELFPYLLQQRETEINIAPKCGSRLERCQTNRDQQDLHRVDVFCGHHIIRPLKPVATVWPHSPDECDHILRLHSIWDETPVIVTFVHKIS